MRIVVDARNVLNSFRPLAVIGAIKFSEVSGNLI